jgi:hypothetical protein
VKHILPRPRGRDFQPVDNLTDVRRRVWRGRYAIRSIVKLNMAALAPSILSQTWI